MFLQARQQNPAASNESTGKRNISFSSTPKTKDDSQEFGPHITKHASNIGSRKYWSQEDAAKFSAASFKTKHSQQVLLLVSLLVFIPQQHDLSLGNWIPAGGT